MKIISGTVLLGLRFKPLFPYFSGNNISDISHASSVSDLDISNAFTVIDGDFVTTDSGTGIVHVAPGFGEDDHNACKANGIPIVCPVDDGGKFEEYISDIVYNLNGNEERLSLAGRHVFETNEDIIRYLKSKNAVVNVEQYLHNYPHCWRTDTPLIYKAVSSWYVAVTKIKDRMVELNKDINWIPYHVRDGIFGKWLQGARDWSISRNRFWGCPVPVWKSNNTKYPRIDVYGSIAELEDDFGQYYEETHGCKLKINDLHRPFIDQLVRPNPDDPSGESMMIRTEDVLDCWFESGSMPYASIHYPFAYNVNGKLIRTPEENVEWFQGHFPADFIVEYIAQTRGWFYTLMVLGVALFDKVPFKNCICHGVILDENNQKLSKRLNNYPDPMEMFNIYGSDAMRFMMARSAVMKGNDISIDRNGEDVYEIVRTTISSLWNVFSFFKMYFEADFRILLNGRKLIEMPNKFDFLFSKDSKHVMDQYILAKLHVTIKEINYSMQDYNTQTACKTIDSFLEVLSNWYIRRSRQRFWSNLSVCGEEYLRLLNYIKTIRTNKRLHRDLKHKIEHDIENKTVIENNDLNSTYRYKQYVVARNIIKYNDQDWLIQCDEDSKTIILVEEDKAFAYKTLYTSILLLVQASAPLLPCITEEIYMELC